MKDGVLIFRTQAVLLSREFDNRDTLERPAVRTCHLLDLKLGFREGDVEHLLPFAHAFQEELKANGSLASAGLALDKEHMRGRQTAGKDIIQPRYACL